MYIHQYYHYLVVLNKPFWEKNEQVCNRIFAMLQPRNGGINSIYFGDDEYPEKSFTFQCVDDRLWLDTMNISKNLS